VKKPARQDIGGNMPPEPTLPEVDPRQLIDPRVMPVLPQLLAQSFPELPTGRDQLLKDIAAWVEEHTCKDGVVRVTGDVDCGDTRDKLKEIQDFCKLEVEPVRVATKRPIDDIAKAVQTWFVEGMQTPLWNAAAPLQQANTAYLKAVDDRRLAEAAAAVEAKRHEAEALADTGRFDASIEVEAEANRLQQQTESESSLDRTRVRGDMGSLTGLKTTWKWQVENLMDMVQAVAAGRLSIEWLTVNEAYANFKIKPKDGDRKVPGLNIYAEKKAK
jgi:hypothetical protein